MRRSSALLVVTAVLLASCGGHRGHVAAVGENQQPARCPAGVDRGPLPRWARTGFSGDGSGVPHVVGRRGAIAAVVFGWPLRTPPREDRANKVLWVPRETPQVPGPLRIAARRTLGGRTVHRVIESGPGPSYVDLPARGCWRLRLRWGSRRDTLDLPVS